MISSKLARRRLRGTVLSASRTLYSTLAALFLGTVAYAVLAHAGSLHAAGIVRLAVESGGLAVVAARVLAVRTRRLPWVCMLASNIAWTVADLVCTDLLHGRGAQLAGSLYMVSYAFAYALIVTLLWSNAIRPWRAFLALDGLAAGLTVAAGFMALLHALDAQALHDATVRDLASDVLLLTTGTLALGMRGWRPGRAWWLLAGGVLMQTSVDGALVVHPPADLAFPGAVATTLWLLGFVVYTTTAWVKPPRRVTVPSGWPTVVAPLASGAIALLLLVHAGITGGDEWTVGLAGAALFFGWVRTMLLIGENLRLLAAARRDADTDKLTGLPNRRALIDELGRAHDHTLVFLDLDGFKEYNDAFGHAAGDALLQRQAPRLAAVGRAYRLGGDEFCVLLDGDRGEDDQQVLAAVAALSEHGDGFEIGASFGLVATGGDAAEALRLADERMYARKRRRRAGQRGRRATCCCRCWPSATTAPPRSRGWPRPWDAGWAWTPRSSTCSSAPPSCTTSAWSPCPTRSVQRTCSIPPRRRSSASTPSRVSGSWPSPSRCARWRESSAPRTSAGTGPATPTGWRPRRSRSRPGSSPSATRAPTTVAAGRGRGSTRGSSSSRPTLTQLCQGSATLASRWTR
jgi:diguanylate cyclase (GGDEF)-like protein